MIKRLPQLLFTLFVITSLGTIAFAQEVPTPVVVGQLDFLPGDIGIEIVNLTGPGDTVSTSTGAPLSFNNKLLTVTAAGGQFTVIDSEFQSIGLGNPGYLCTDANCLAAEVGATSATLTGTFDPTTGLQGLPSYDTVIEASFLTVEPPQANIIAEALPEPGAWGLIFALTGLALIWRVAPWCWRRLQSSRLSLA
jgi:hypothetical protein